MFVDNANCLARWLSFATSVEVIEGDGLGRRQIVHGRYHLLCSSVEQEITAYEPARLVSWTHPEEHPAVNHIPRLDRTTVITVELIPEGAGTRVRIESAQEPAGPLRGLAMRLVTQRAVERHIKLSLEQLAGMLKGRVTL
jgi:uncharacterized protein YndB with AHSA1/START domain